MEPLKAHSRQSAQANDSDLEATKESSFFERRDHRDLVVHGLLTGDLPLKFAYAGSAAFTHDVLARGAGYQSVTGAVGYVRDALRKAGLEDLSRIAEIGPGNGLSSLGLLELARDAVTAPREFLALDFSETLLGVARHNFANHRDDLSFTGEIWDVEAGPTDFLRNWGQPRGPLPVLFLGNTIGNLADPAGALRDILDSILPSDVLFLGVTLRAGTAAELVAPYETEVFHDAALEPLRSLGVDAWRLEMTWDEVSGAVVGTAVLREPRTVADQDLPAGHRVRCFVSRRFAADEAEALVEAAGGTVGAVTSSPSGEHLVLTVTKKRPR
ncbi:L-histidine N-alpha-methyltransferase [Actinoplanes octamycinicus]|uniref:L-histidine N-alpha-methyltransferase n=1 Tax=Actinoplanes octamycinicus TaxID=135948 RepID=A0A7W7M9Y6_9ACTN|nr:L-histidine N(alpha)-methyltransferase [Actinoplanes octamycinicus]MBB4742489.1 L-histidine N-alpha-methyltransferase [Actinoplanes octamycinicus]GIE60827.1 hypothetical protein Aoc01nite_62290 [Actinoplanes octamycinicus]